MRPNRPQMQKSQGRKWKGLNQPSARSIRGLAVRVLFFCLHLMPAAFAWSAGSRQALWFVSAVLIATAVIWLCEAGGAVRRLMAIALNLSVACANALLAVSYMIQGVGFNIEFFAHANMDTLAIASVALRPLLLVFLAYLLLTAALPMLIGRRSLRRGGIIGVVTVGGVLLNGPVWSFGWHIASNALDAQSALWVPKPDKVARVSLPANTNAAKEPYGLVLIFAESLEASYARPEIFGEDLTEHLSGLSTQGLQFTDMHQVSYTSWTTGALVAAQCGRPMGADDQRHSMLRPFALDARLENTTCMGDVLLRHGYHPVLMAGTSLDFAGIGDFHAAHGFGERLGFDALMAKAGPLAMRKWGKRGEHDNWLLEDDALFALARNKLEDLAAQPRPFVLVLTTMDTHGPTGFPSVRCGSSQGLIAAVRCADRVISEFIEDVRIRHPNTVVALFSDHLVGPGGVESEVMEKLAPHADERRLRFTVWGPNVAPGVIDRPGTHFDLMPTLMDLLGLDAWTEHNLGASLLRHDSPWFSLASPLSLRVVQGLAGVRLRPGDAVAFAPQGPLMEVDGHRILATGKGLSLRDAIFALEIDAEGEVASVRAFPDQAPASVPSNGAAAAFTRWAVGRRIVGVSTNRAFNLEALDGEPAETSFFVGEFGAENFVLAPLHARRTVAWPGAAK